MAVFGIIADIHGNLEALEAVLAELDRRAIDRIACLGDVVGYNADPDACAAILRERGIPSVAGNHDLIATGRLGLDRCSNKAAYALRRTRKTIAAETRRYLESLPEATAYDGGFVAVHAAVGDVQRYLRRPDQVREAAEPFRERFPDAPVCFFAHTHEPSVFALRGSEAESVAIEGPIRLDDGATWFVNPGSVDASRKRAHKLAEFAVFDAATRGIEFHRVPYDDDAVEAKAASGGYRIGPWTDRLYTARRRARAAFRKAKRLAWGGP